MASVPNTNTFTLNNVYQSVASHDATVSPNLSSCFTKANSLYFDSQYNNESYDGNTLPIKGMKRFRNYGPRPDFFFTYDSAIYKVTSATQETTLFRSGTYVDSYNTVDYHRSSKTVLMRVDNARKLSLCLITDANANNEIVFTTSSNINFVKCIGDNFFVGCDNTIAVIPYNSDGDMIYFKDIPTAELVNDIEKFGQYYYYVTDSGKIFKGSATYIENTTNYVSTDNIWVIKYDSSRAQKRIVAYNSYIYSFGPEDYNYRSTDGESWTSFNVRSSKSNYYTNAAIVLTDFGGFNGILTNAAAFDTGISYDIYMYKGNYQYSGSWDLLHSYYTQYRERILYYGGKIYFKYTDSNVINWESSGGGINTFYTNTISGITPRYFNFI